MRHRNKKKSPVDECVEKHPGGEPRFFFIFFLIPSPFLYDTIWSACYRSLYKCIRVAIESCGVGVKVDLVVSVTLFILPFIKRKGPNFDSLTSLLSSLRIPSALKSNLKILPTAWNDRTEFIFLGLLLNFLSYFFLLFSPRFHTDILVQRKCILLKREIENLNISFEMMKA